MLYNRTATIARIIGLGICLFSTWISVWCTVLILAGVSGMHDVPSQPPGWEALIVFPILGLVVWSITSLGEWFWSFEEGWFRLQRFLRFIQATLILGGLACALVFRLAFEWRLL